MRLTHDTRLLRVVYSSIGAWYVGLYSGDEYPFDAGSVRSQQCARDIATYCEHQYYAAEMEAQAECVPIDTEYKPQRTNIGEPPNETT